MSKKLIALFLLSVLACSFAPALAKHCSDSVLRARYASEIGKTVRDIQTVMIPMRDGVKLSTTIVFPMSNAKTFSTVIDRSPYGHQATELIADVFLLIGYVAVGQDMRGTCASEGNFTIWKSDSHDGYDTMAWIAAQSWSDQRIYQVGASADGVASYVMTKDMSPYLKAQTVLVATGAAHGTLYPGGAFRQGLLEAWLRGTVPNQAEALIREVRANERPGPWWDALNMTTSASNITFPTVHWAGWDDIFIDGQLEAFQRYQKESVPAVRGQSYLVVDPLGHCQAAANQYPKNLILGRITLPISLAFALFQGTLKDNVPQNANKVTFYVMGANDISAPGNYWTSLPDWPAYKPDPWFMAKGGALLTSPANGASAGNATYTFDPKNPVPTVGGNNLEIACGPLDQRSVEQGSRSDVLTFTSDEFKSAYYITGPVHARLFVSTTGVDTDFTAKFTDVYPDGSSHLLGDGIVRMRWRAGERGGYEPQLVTPNKIYEVNVSLLNTSYVFAPGHKLRVSISSSNYPRFHVNYNNGASVIEQENTTPVVVQNTLYLSPNYPSALYLPRVDPSQIPEMKFTSIRPSETRRKRKTSARSILKRSKLQRLRENHEDEETIPPSEMTICDVVAKRRHGSYEFFANLPSNSLYYDLMKECGF